MVKHLYIAFVGIVFVLTVFGCDATNDADMYERQESVDIEEVQNIPDIGTILSHKHPFEDNSITHYNVLFDETTPLAFSTADNNVLYGIANFVYFTSQMGDLRGGIADINGISHVQELREIEGYNNAGPSHYCIYENSAHGRLYVFFRGGGQN